MLAGWLAVSPSSSWTVSNDGVSRNALCTRVFHTGWAMNLLDCSFGRTCHVRFRGISVAWGCDNWFNTVGAHDCILRLGADCTGGAGEHQTPRAEPGIPRELVLEHVRLAKHHLQSTQCVIHEGNTRCVSIWNQVSRLEQGVIKLLEKLGRDVIWILDTNPCILAELLLAD